MSFPNTPAKTHMEVRFYMLLYLLSLYSVDTL